jgi:hypothetical protein
MALKTRMLAFAFGSFALCAAGLTSAPAGAAAITDRLAVAPAADAAGQPVEMQRRGGGFRGGGFRGGGFRGGFRGGGPRFAGPRFAGGPRWGGPRPGWGGPRPGWVRPWPGPRYRYGWRRPWVAPLVVAPPVAAGVWAGGNCRRVLRYNRWGEPVWVTRCCRVVIDYDGFRRRICRRV